MIQNQWFAVRCCCTPQKVFGFLKLLAPESTRLPDNRVLTDNMGQCHLVKLMPIYVNRHLYCSMSNYLKVPPPNDVLERTVPEIAIYSDDRPIEFWRTIPGFVEAPSED